MPWYALRDRHGGVHDGYGVDIEDAVITAALNVYDGLAETRPDVNRVDLIDDSDDVWIVRRIDGAGYRVD